ncbi:MAG TPA: response regulator [Planctomycetes bacterium]|nr:response regulator [Planctomycetota bacterium]
MSKWVSILVVDNDEIVRNVLKYDLKLDGFNVYVAEDGPTGIKLAQENGPELILLDWMMPGMDGLEVLSELKHDERTEDIPVFMLTGRGAISYLNRAIDAGADDYIKKPFKLKELSEIVKDKWREYKRKYRANVW